MKSDNNFRNLNVSKKAKIFFSNFSYAIISNIVSLIASTLAVLLVPKLIGIEAYGYWQLYIFYTTYVGFMHLGWNDGIYLRYGGEQYEKLNKPLFFSQFYMLAVTQIVIALIISFFSIFIFQLEDKVYILQMTSACLVIVNLSNMLIFILQSTNRIKEYALVTIIGKVTYLVLLVVLLLMIGVTDFKLLIMADLIAKTILLSCVIYLCRDFIFLNISSFYFNFKETFENISVGIKLMLANIASLLVVGVVRFGIERSWDVSSFGKVSLTLSLSNFILVFINTLGIVLFPILRRADVGKLPLIYMSMRDLLMILLLAILIFYYPLQVILSMWLPEYSDSLKYMAFLLPICIYEGKVSLLINTYLKTLREEKSMLNINIISLILSSIFTFFTTIVMKSLDLAVLSIIIVLIIRCIFAEVILSKKLGISVYKDISLEFILTSMFIITAWYLNSWWVMILYGATYIIYLVIKSKDLKYTFINFRILLKTE
ncbi:hypothetical protein [Planococcus sp. SSTMD024]|uniref:hypothetical protein n=1 Tax=Planococcus sp. SSTMD024 TaxID=3242163 RepID=UPI00351F7CC2